MSTAASLPLQKKCCTWPRLPTKRKELLRTYVTGGSCEERHLTHMLYHQKYPTLPVSTENNILKSGHDSISCSKTIDPNFLATSVKLKKHRE
ncbi:hypothetical protein AVEN_244248-1 [Araneus ventricosus]|uniref:Uncharacterized protein n=1 Tax=Araneus ventricosus TaxID=182803 RepID=A0A4Y2TR44_ARAVE|nr:hypothetical protein AVEN_244248-1 [Araneus ventricosus]